MRLVDEVIDYIAALVRGTRENPDLETGASSACRGDAGGRGAGRARRSTAATSSFPTTSRCLRPRCCGTGVILSPAAEINGRKVEEIVTTIIEAIEAPR